MEQKQIKGLVMKIQNNYVKFRKNSIIFDQEKNLLQGELLVATKLKTLSGHLLTFKGIVKFSGQKVIKGFLTKPQQLIVANQKVRVQGFVQFTADEVLNKNRKFNNNLSKEIEKALLEMAEDEVTQAETIEYFTLANHQYITRPQQKIIRLTPSQNLKRQLYKY
jgi:uncharacterized protein YrrD